MRSGERTALTVEALSETSIVATEWRLSDAIVVGLILLIVMFVGLFLQFTPLNFRPIYLTRFQASQVVLVASLTIQLVLGGIVILHVARKRHVDDPLSSLGWKLRNDVALFALIGFALAAVMTVGLSRWIGVGTFADGSAPLSLILYFASTVLLQPFIEELYFRGLLFITLADKIGEVGSVIATTATFVFLHPLHRLTVLPVGLVLGITRAKTRSVAACFALHAAYNIGILVFELLCSK